MTLRSSTRLLLGSALLLPGIALSPALAQTGAGFSQLDVRPPDATASLNASLTRLGQNPRDINALIGAGEAALALDDPRAATGFFARADEIQGGNGRVKAGLGRAMLKLQNPTEALKLFSQAEQLRYPADSFIGDRALARDLAGDQAGAQRDYQAALLRKPDDPELIRRYAVSLGISGQVDAAEKVIEPLLYKNDRAAWRNRAFVLAMNGRDQEARVITQKVMPKPLADAIQPYMDRMAGLTPAQRAAAVHFGNFPSNAGVRMAANTATAPRAVTPVPATPAPSVDTRKAVTRSSTSTRFRNVIPLPAPVQRQAQSMPAQSTPAPATPIPTPGPIFPASAATITPSGPSGPVRTARNDAPPPANTAPRTATPVVQPQRAAPATAAAPGSAPVQGPIDPAPRSPQWAAATPPAASPPIAQQQPPVQQPASPSPSPVATRTLADIIRELDVPETERRSQVAAVDLSEIAARQSQKRLAARAAADKAKRDAAAKAKAEADAKAKALAAEKAKLAKNPSRNWVQIGTGQSVSALGFTLRGLRKKHDSLTGKDAYTASWGRTNRLVVGPFASFTKAKDFEATLKKGGADVFTWQSEAGEEVSPVK
ncbi:MAG: SPOR domain-containing protein [Sphingobium sp.]